MMGYASAHGPRPSRQALCGRKCFGRGGRSDRRCERFGAEDKSTETCVDAFRVRERNRCRPGLRSEAYDGERRRSGRRVVAVDLVVSCEAQNGVEAATLFSSFDRNDVERKQSLQAPKKICTFSRGGPRQDTHPFHDPDGSRQRPSALPLDLLEASSSNE